MKEISAPPRAWWTAARLVHAHPVARDLQLVELELRCTAAAAFLPGQFAMLHFSGRDELVFGRPFSLLASESGRVEVLYRVVGEGTARLAAARDGAALVYFGPLGQPFPPPPDDLPVVLLAGGVGLPPLLAWWRRYARAGDLALFGGRDPGDVPWELLNPAWLVSVDRPGEAAPPRPVFAGHVVALCEQTLRDAPPGQRRLLACGPLPMLRGAAALAAARGWPCLVSVEEHMGCGYGVCRGCVVPARDGGHLTACQDGPVLDAAAVDWELFGRRDGGGAL